MGGRGAGGRGGRNAGRGRAAGLRAQVLTVPACIHAHAHIRAHPLVASTQTCASLRPRTPTIGTRTNTHTNTHARTHACMHARTHARTHERTHTQAGGRAGGREGGRQTGCAVSGVSTSAADFHTACTSPCQITREGGGGRRMGTQAQGVTLSHALVTSPIRGVRHRA